VIYLDGSALCRFLPGVRHYEAFGAWARDHVDELVTTQLGFTELRQAAELYPRSAAERVAEIVSAVRTGVAVIRFSDDNVEISSHATAVLKPFAALHVGAAVAHPKVDTVVTYDPALANVARIYELAVESPGLPEDWYLEYEGPPEHWKPVALDAPYDPGAEFDVPEVALRPDAYEVALEEARLEAAAKASQEQADAPGATSHEDGVDADATSGTKEVSELERALREAEAAAQGSAEADDLDQTDEGEAELAGEASPAQGAGARGTDELAGLGSAARIGTYRPRIEAWHEGDAEEDRPKFEPDGEAEMVSADTGEADTGEADSGEAGDGLPWSLQPELTVASQEPDSLPPMPPALAPPAPIEPVGIPNLPREERGVPPVMPPARTPIGSAVRRPMFETEPHPESRASRPPDPVPPVPPEESSPLTVPIKWNVELDEPEAYLPLRFDSESARVLPSASVSFAGGQGGLTLKSAGNVSVPALEPTGPQPGSAILSDYQSPMARPGTDAPRSARERKAADKALKKEDVRRGKAVKKAKGTASPLLAPAAASTEEWKLDDVLNFGPKKRGS
jgi:hypothetical protein